MVKTRQQIQMEKRMFCPDATNTETFMQDLLTRMGSDVTVYRSPQPGSARDNDKILASTCKPPSQFAYQPAPCVDATVGVLNVLEREVALLLYTDAMKTTKGPMFMHPSAYRVMRTTLHSFVLFHLGGDDYSFMPFDMTPRSLVDTYYAMADGRVRVVFAQQTNYEDAMYKRNRFCTLMNRLRLTKPDGMTLDLKHVRKTHGQDGVDRFLQMFEYYAGHRLGCTPTENLASRNDFLNMNTNAPLETPAVHRNGVTPAPLTDDEAEAMVLGFFA